MATIKQIEANRRNAQKSTGPRSVAGKAVSSQNTLKTGIDAQALLICGENKADLEALIAGYYQRFQPTTPEERCLVDIAIRAEWQLRRLSAVEAELWEHQIEQLPEKEGYLRRHGFQLADATFARLQRRVEQTERSFHRGSTSSNAANSPAKPRIPTRPRPSRPLKTIRPPPNWLRSATSPSGAGPCPSQPPS